MIARMDSIDYLEDLMRIESHESVTEIQQHLLETIKGATLDETGCVYAEKVGKADGPRIILNTHMDVVSPHNKFERDGDVIRGRGACDAKGILAPMVAAFSRLDVKAGSLKLLISPDEETTHRGLDEYASDGIEGDFAVVGEPTGLDICPSARGHYDLIVELFGKSAHGATPERGINTTVCAAEAITKLRDHPRLEDEDLGTNNFTPTIIEGGNRPNQVPEYTKFIVDYRLIPAETGEDAVETLRSVLKGLECESEIGYYDEGASLGSFKTDKHIEYISWFQNVTEQITGIEAHIRPFDAATEAAVIASHMPVIVFGPGLISDGEQAIAHSEREFVPVQEVENATEILYQFLAETL